MDQNMIITSYDAALNEADNLVRVTKNMETAFNNLNDFMKKYATSQIRTDWMDTVFANWQKYLESDIPAVLADMQKSAVNIQTAVREAEAYSTEQSA
ncbi:MAG: hypothetical protein J6X28_06105 [Bacilli bacterium]|nr:hypothetical protein [Bacilli bacterium]